MQCFLRLNELRLVISVLDGCFFSYARSLGISLGGGLLLSLNVVDSAGECCQRLDCFRPFDTHVGKHRREHRHIARFAHRVEQLDERSVGVGLNQFGKLLDVHTCRVSELRRLFVELYYYLA